MTVAHIASDEANVESLECSFIPEVAEVARKQQEVLELDKDLQLFLCLSRINCLSDC